MVDPVTYLYYRCYKLYSRFNKENPAFQYGALFGVMVFSYIAAIIALVNKEFPSNAAVFISMLLSIFLTWIVSHFEDKIVKKYDNISNRKKKIGDIIFIVEIVITILAGILLIRI